jgi:predicted RecB family nuclease
MPARITRDVIESYLNCRYKGYLTLAGASADPSEYQTLQLRCRLDVRSRAIAAIRADHAPGEVASDLDLSLAVLKRGMEYLIDVRAEDESVSLSFDGLRRVSGRSLLGDFHYAPVLYHEGEKVGSVQRLLLAALGRTIGDIQGRQPDTGFVYRGRSCCPVRVRLTVRLHEDAGRAWRDLREQQMEASRPRLTLNSHCAECQFRDECRQEAMRIDDLSLLRGLREKDIRRFARKGILTVTQLAHTFRPRRKRRQSRDGGHGHNPALQALAIRDRKTYVFGSPRLPDAPVRVYLDLEGKSGEPFIYLVGVIVAQGPTESRYSFWADRPEDEPRVFEQLLQLLRGYDDFRIFCYGSYERAFLKRMRKHALRKRLADQVLARTTNVLSVIYDHVYFPVYSNGLKDVARFLGFAWADPDASGLQSLVWRAGWEQTGEESFKQRILQYNLDDCAALKRVVEVLFAIAPGEVAAKAAPAAMATMPPLARVEELDTLAFPRKSGSIEFVNPDFAAVNKLAYFDYQRERVYVRTSRTLRKSVARSKKRINRKLRVSKEVFVKARRCPHCRSEKVAVATGDGVPVWTTAGKRAFDLVITSAGIKRRVIRCRTRPHRCSDCGRIFVPEAYERLDKHYHGLKSWAMHMHVGHRLGLAVVEVMFREQFGLDVDRVELHMFKGLLARYYQQTYRQLLSSLRSGNLIHVDETEVPLRTGRGYIWVFASVETVLFQYKPTREGGFLEKYLEGFQGVLVSDFYAAYDALPCPKQRCLIHLIRDMNQLLLNHPFDAELKSVTESFGHLLRVIVTTIDQHGLKRRHLGAHRQAVTDLFNSLSDQPFRSDTAEDLRQRLLRNRDELFTFLEHDGVPWNNNNAENAIRQFGYYRDRTAGRMSEEGLQDYLVLLSLCHTCRYRGVSFLQFLRSGQRDLDRFCPTRRRRRFPEVQVYPKGFIPPHYSSVRKPLAANLTDEAAERTPIESGGQEVKRSGETLPRSPLQTDGQDPTVSGYPRENYS